ncbi:pyridoxamine 5'-phosphate oxidase family protein [Zavarzinia compransoris]|uniref:pyridoxamine 5'-phosphate oxidase family protein n=1 Tax=Zavarzinia marina TaxID=2911065 RepID=UPI001F3CC20F|nr:pyridoxamine 5'-phosphate oxidase family protein [Zavarzinia marina]MCF4166800.1 pyridoxamine 5'-phosphate oxidase family protein [Zavarzinia marina]
MTDNILDEAGLRTVYPMPSDGATMKQLSFLDVHCSRFIELSPFVCIGTSRPDGGADVSPRGGAPGFVHVLDANRLAMPDWPGNNRLDSLGNLTAHPAVGLLFFVPGFDEMLRVNGRGVTVTTPDLMERFLVDGKPPRSVLLITVEEAFLHCTKALKRSALWDPARHVARDAMPSFGQMLKDQLNAPVPAEAIDQMLEADARDNLY